MSDISLESNNSVNPSALMKSHASANSGVQDKLEKKIFIQDLKSKSEIESIFFVKFISLMESRDGRFYLHLVFSDSSGEVEGRLWTNAEKINEEIEKGNFVKVQGKINLFQGRKQFIVNTIEQVDAELVDDRDFIVTAKESPEKMYKELLELVTQLEDVYIKELLTNILTDQEISKRLKIWNAGKTIHHAYMGGLIEHILDCVKLSFFLSKFYRLNENYVVAGAILHDIGKIYELSSGINVEYTEEGKLVGHMPKALELIDRFTYKIRNFPFQVKLHLKHIILSHHGEYEYGAPKLPQTSEAMLVHLIDHLDSKMNSFDMVKKNDNSTGHWSNFIKHLDRIVYKNELPVYREYQDVAHNLSEKEKEKASQKKPSDSTINQNQNLKTTKKDYFDNGKEMKQNLSSLLSNFKVKE